MTDFVFPARRAGQIVALFASKNPLTDDDPLPADHPDIVAYHRWGSATLEEVSAALQARIDSEAETQRLRYVTPGAGQALTYNEKRAEAERIETDTEPDPAHYPMLSAAVGIDGATLQDVGAAVRRATALWVGIAAQIEQVRLAGKRAVRAATTREAAEAAYAAVTWPNT